MAELLKIYKRIKAGFDRMELTGLAGNKDK